MMADKGTKAEVWGLVIYVREDFLYRDLRSGFFSAASI